MAYSADSFVADEVPTTAKWNKLWNNDASFNDGTGIADNAIGSRAIRLANNEGLNALNSSASEKELMRLDNDNYLRIAQLPRQNNTSNSTKENILIQYGYGVMPTGAATAKSETVTFPTAYSSVPVVVCQYGGDDTGGSATLGAGGLEDQTAYAYATSVTTSTFVARATATANWGAGTTAFYHWIAIGEKS